MVFGMNRPFDCLHVSIFSAWMSGLSLPFESRVQKIVGTNRFTIAWGRFCRFEFNNYSFHEVCQWHRVYDCCQVGICHYFLGIVCWIWYIWSGRLIIICFPLTMPMALCSGWYICKALIVYLKCIVCVYRKPRAKERGPSKPSSSSGARENASVRKKQKKEDSPSEQTCRCSAVVPMDYWNRNEKPERVRLSRLLFTVLVLPMFSIYTADPVPLLHVPELCFLNYLINIPTNYTLVHVFLLSCLIICLLSQYSVASCAFISVDSFMFHANLKALSKMITQPQLNLKLLREIWTLHELNRFNPKSTI